MFSDLAGRPLNTNAYNDDPFTFLDQSAQIDLANITAINLIENGDRQAREQWQNRQLTNLLKHAQSHSKFWRQRMPSRMINHGIMKYLPIQSREDIATQSKLDGSLAARDSKTPVSSYASTGSTGTPVKVYVCPENGYYNRIRSLAQYFINDLSLEENVRPYWSRQEFSRAGKKVIASDIEQFLGWFLECGLPQWIGEKDRSQL